LGLGWNYFHRFRGGQFRRFFNDRQRIDVTNGPPGKGLVGRFGKPGLFCLGPTGPLYFVRSQIFAAQAKKAPMKRILTKQNAENKP